MIGAVGMARRYMAHHAARSAMLIACVTIVFALPAVTRTLVARFDAALYARARTVPVVVGAKGSRFDLVFGALYFRATGLAPTPLGEYDKLLREPNVTAIPIHARFTARKQPVVATSIEYLELRGLSVSDGRIFARIGEAVVGSRAAEVLEVTAGDRLFTDQRHSYDITGAPALKLDVVGVLAPTGTPDDDAVLVDLETAWVLEGIAHGHADAQTIDRPEMLFARTEDNVMLTGAVITYQEITDANAASFHVHGERADLPLTAILVFPETDKVSTIVRARINASPGHQAVVPERVIDDLMAFVVRVQRLFDVAALVLATATALLLGLIGALSWRVREDEIRTLREIGCARGTVGLLFGAELVMVLVAGATGAAVVTGAVVWGVGRAWGV